MMNGDRDEPAGNRGQRKASTNIPVFVECPLEPRISEITYDGREDIRPSVSKAEKLYRNASKLDFRKVDEQNENYDELVSVGVSDAKEKEKKTSHVRPDPSTIVTGLESVRNKLTTAYTEISVLHDILLLTKDRRYLHLDPTTNDSIDAKPIEPKPYFNLHYKKAAIGSAGKILLNAAERLRTSSDSKASVQKNDHDYNMTLIKLREQWRLKKSGQHVSGDLSYRTVGSVLKGIGQFEIRKTDEDDERAMEIVIAGDLSGESCIQIDIMTGDLPTKDYESDLKTRDVWGGGILAMDDPWHRMLITAQNSLFCREIIIMLSAEAVTMQNTSLSSVAYSDEIHYTSLHGHSVRVKLIQISEAETKKHKSPNRPSIVYDSHNTLAESRILEYSTAMMLLQRMRDISNPDVPVPSCGPLGLKNFRRKMSIQARDRRVWKQSIMNRTMTAELLDRTEALLLRKRCLNFADKISCPDLQVVVHDSSFMTSWKCANVKVTLVTPGYDMYQRTNCAFNINQGQVSFITRDYVVPIHTIDKVECQPLYIEIVRQHSSVLQHVLKSLRFEIIHYAPNHDYFKMTATVMDHSLVNAARYAIIVVAKSYDEKWLIKIVCSLRYVYRLFVANKRNRPVKTNAIRDETFLESETDFREVDLNKVIGGDTRLRRISLVLGYLLSLPLEHPFLRHPEQKQLSFSRENRPWTKWNAL